MLLDFDSANLKGESFSSHSEANMTSEEKLEEMKINKSLSILKTKFSFGEIREKLTTLLITRFLSDEVGLELVEKFYPDWLE